MRFFCGLSVYSYKMIYIQSDVNKTRPHHFDAACAMYGAIENDRKYKLLPFEELSGLNGDYAYFMNQHHFVGSVEFMREVFRLAGIETPRLPSNSDRECEFLSLSEALIRAKGGERLFIKPIETKLFTGFVYEGFEYSLLDKLPGETPVMVYQPFEHKILSEWRIYVHKHKITDSHQYEGNYRFTPDYNKFEEMVETNKQKGFPIAYTIDVAVLENGENVVVEFNDMWAIGNYGVPNWIYLTMLRDRYFEIMKP